MNLLTKTAPWVVASLLATASAFSQSKCPPTQKTFGQGDELMPNQYMAAYNAPARIDVRGAWDFYAFGSFTYWQARQENMEIAFVDYDQSDDAYSFDGYFVNMNPGYKPGFKVGVGMNCDLDNWDVCAVYTWFRSTQHQGTTSRDADIIPIVGHPEVMNAYTYTSSAAKWKLHMDLLDLEMGRSYYSGMNLTFRPFVAVRAAWIRQYFHSIYQFDGTIGSNPTVHHVHSDSAQKTQSWAVGPRAGLYTNWILGQGFRFYGNGAVDILYTRYNKLRELSTASSTIAGSAPYQFAHARQKNNDFLRTHMEMELGIGWATYFDNNNWHVDLAAGYTFQTFFNQNMFRHYTNANPTLAAFPLNSLYSNVPNGDLFIHGLTASARFDF